jgi:hypothetical protein
VVLVLLPVLAALVWYVWSPRMALVALTDFDADPADIARLYVREDVRAGFGAQTMPQVDTYPPPLTKDVVLDALSDPRSVRMLVAEPYGEWQFAAWEGLPQRLRAEVSAAQGAAQESMPSMPRVLETTKDWTIERRGISEFVARAADRPRSKTYRFVRRGLSWRLVEIDLGTAIR